MSNLLDRQHWDLIGSRLQSLTIIPCIRGDTPSFLLIRAIINSTPVGDWFLFATNKVRLTCFQ